jgi:hypothetical protein
VLDDPLSIDRRLGDVARSLASFRAALRAGRGEDHAFELAGRFASHDLLRDLADATKDPLAPALLRTAHALHEAHALAAFEREHAVALRVERHAVDEPERGHFTLSELAAHALADTRGRRAGFFTTLAARAQPAADSVLRRAERHAELRASLDKLVPPDIDLPGTGALDLAPSVLTRTDEAFHTLGARTLAELVELGLGRDSRASWPARLTPRTTAELLGDAPWLRHATPDAFRVPTALGAASHLRALFGLGASLRSAFAGKHQPFVLARDPYGLERATFGALFALLPTRESFARRSLGITPAASSDHRRCLARVLLIALREAALRVTLRAPSFGGARTLSRAYPELAFTALGSELPLSLLGVLFTPRPNDTQRFAGLLLAAARAHDLTEEHDDDWFRNPRAVEQLREEARPPAATLAPPAELERGATLLVAWLAQAL